ncbi:(d)CMP kinase [Stygiolobus caldivivus]|uniref:Cytidylate kinase n=1 Tax=Stygiolobus caldivivus TaxID=2824673 RepID=A0A8D5ZIJ2_9CREN|nr:AAA family ATPase [Stygiolobus caldivivus]BCU70664.1 cytidylate kinase [Stygiolobus caldivivus]
MIIIISGPPGSGKSSVAKILSTTLSVEYISAGMLFRKIAEERGVSLVELNKMAEKDFEIDKAIDMELLSLVSGNNKNLVIESHIAGWLFHNFSDLTVYLTAPLITRARRVASRDKIPESEALDQIIKREESHKDRFFRYYGIDLSDLTVFDLVINTENISPNSIADIILDYLRGKQIRLTHSS